jgi:two-component system heavy metal sensor histidine kinase CusS
MSMRSIRLSLLVYFLGLLVVALGVASVLIYRSARNSFADKEAAVRESIKKKYEERCREERDRLDRDLLRQALALADRLQLQMHWGRMYGIEVGDVDSPPNGIRWIPNSIYCLGAIPSSTSQCGYVSLLPWLAQVQATVPRPEPPADPGRRPAGTRPTGRPSPFVQPTPFAWDLWRRQLADNRQMAEISLNKSPIEFPGGTRPVEYFQIDVNHFGKSLRSKSLEALGLSFPEEEGFGGDKLLYWEPAHDFELVPGHLVRRVRLKASRLRILPGPGRLRRPGPAEPAATSGGKPSDPMPPMPPLVSVTGSTAPASLTRPRTLPGLFIVLQVAADLNKLNEALGRFAEQRDRELDEQKAETADALLNLENRLLAINCITLAATILGAWLLVWFGLLPLHRMSDAVSQVSPRDFQLHLGNAPLPMELRPIAERLATTLDLLKRAFAREKQSTADISHELRTPLAALITTTELALRKPRSAEQYREFLLDCQGSAKQMNQIVERLLTLARLDAGVDRLRPQVVDVAELAEECAAVVRPLAEAQGLKLSVSTPPPAEEREEESLRLSTDPDKLREVLNNLLHNAIQYNRPEGQIDLTVARENGHVRLEVRDTGIGIGEEAKERIFERFYRVDPSRSNDGMNAGLGLALVKEYVDLMGGRIDVQSALGRGSTFRVELPVAGPAVSA